MTTKYYGTNRGGSVATDISTGASTTSKAIELAVVTSTSGITKMDVLKALEAIEAAVTQDNSLPV